MSSAPDVLIVGSGAFGVAAAVELRQRGHRVTLLDGGPVPHPLAASTDISKVVRIEYGNDEEYTALAEIARTAWLRWNEELFDDPLYHEVGLMKLTRAPMSPGSYEYDNYQSLLARGYRIERVAQHDIAVRFPAWNAGLYVDGYVNPRGGYVESGRAVEQLLRHAAAIGVEIHQHRPVVALESAGPRIVGVRTAEGEIVGAGDVVIAAGAWTPVLLPELRSSMRSIGQPVFHLAPSNPDMFKPPFFYVFSADSSQTGWYGFPLHPRANVVKIAHHGRGWPVDPVHDERKIPAAYVERFRAFLAEALPPLAAAEIVYSRCCLYCDTLDEDFWIARHPDRPGLTVAAGDSGHGFKFVPVLGGLIADAVEGIPNRRLDRFRWRGLSGETHGREASRYRGVV
jgi:sarcosine oxidase / L-pipecolate oxidase